jgi:hypothetical protein
MRIIPIPCIPGQARRPAPHPWMIYSHLFISNIILARRLSIHVVYISHLRIHIPICRIADRLQIQRSIRLRWLMGVRLSMPGQRSLDHIPCVWILLEIIAITELDPSIKGGSILDQIHSLYIFG